MSVSVTQTSLQNVLPSYLYQDYNDDPDCQAFVDAYNGLAQQYVNWFNQVPLAVWANGNIVGALLDWCANGLYGVSRPVLTTSASTSRGPINTFVIDSGVPLGSRVTLTTGTTMIASDDFYKRTLTWILYRGDGFQFSLPWLKRRLARFLYGPNGVDPGVQGTPYVSVTCSGTLLTITILSFMTIASQMAQALVDGLLPLPFQYIYSITVTSELVNDGGVLQFVPVLGSFPMSPTGLAAGAIWSNGGVATVVPGVTPTNVVVYFGAILGVDLVAMGGGNLPLSNPGAGTLQLWNNGGVVCVA